MADARTLLLNAPALPNLPWEDRPDGCRDIMWRYTGNPVIERSPHPTINSVFNSAVVPFGDKFAGVFRCDDTRRRMQLHRGFSDDAIHWTIEEDRIEFVADPERETASDPAVLKWEYGYDPRVVWIEDRWWVTWCNGYHGPTIGVAWTKDFESFHKIENSYLPYNRNGVLFPRKINGKYVMLSRPSDRGHTPFGDIYLSASPDMEFWGQHRFVMATASGWQSTKIGAGPIPIETSEGWLLIYHGVLNSCNGFVYAAGVALLDLEQPWKVIARGSRYILNPRTLYECVGDVPNVAFPCAALVDGDTGRLALYYGAADTVTAVAFGYVQELVQFAKDNAL